MSTQDMERVGDVAVFSPSGSIDITNSAALRDEMVQESSSGMSRILLDLAAIQYIDSSGLSALVGTVNELEKANAQLVLCNIDGSVLKVMELTRLTDFFEIVADRDAALEKLGG